MPPLTAAELAQHPEFEHVVWDLKPTQAGKVSVGQGRGGPLDISYEIHGKGRRRMVFMMGLGSLKSAWQRQTKDFGHTRGDQYSVLIFDNRGIGDSSKPLMRYSTSEMAHDVLELLTSLSWTDQPHSLHIISISMGGMIAQELALLLTAPPSPSPIASLTLISTAARLVNTVGFFENLRSRINLLIPKSLDAQLANTKHLIATPGYCTQPDELEYTVQPFPTAGDRFAASDLWKRSRPELFTRTGFVAQMLAAGWHHKSAEQVGEIAKRVGRERICVMHGTEDRMISVPHGRTLIEELSRGAGEGKGVKSIIWEGQAHIIPIEKRSEFTRVMEDIMDNAENIS